MPSFSEILVLLAAILAAGYALSALRSKELARAAGQRACRQAGVQFLDDTVVLVRVRPRRDAHGQLVWHREYRFEFSANDHARHPGRIALLGKRLESIVLEEGERWAG